MLSRRRTGTREDYLEAEERVIRELQEIGKPFVVLLNSAEPHSSRAASIVEEIAEKYGVNCLAVNCQTLSEQEIQRLLRGLLYEFPLQELDVFLPSWVDALPGDHPIKSGLYQSVAAETAEPDGYSGQSRHLRRGVQSGDGYPHRCGASYVVGHGVCHRQAGSA